MEILSKPPLYGNMPITTAAQVPERSLECPLALLAYIFINHDCVIKKRERKAHRKIAKANIGVQELSIRFSCSMSSTIATAEELPTDSWR